MRKIPGNGSPTLLSAPACAGLRCFHRSIRSGPSHLSSIGTLTGISRECAARFSLTLLQASSLPEIPVFSRSGTEIRTNRWGTFGILIGRYLCRVLDLRGTCAVTAAHRFALHTASTTRTILPTHAWEHRAACRLTADLHAYWRQPAESTTRGVLFPGEIRTRWSAARIC